MKNNSKTVFVGVSGGVDSSVSALLLKQQGYNVVGVFIRTWTPDFIDCTWRDERRDAMRVCAHLDIPFLECDAEEAYKKGVADYMIEEYKSGNTPNPDVMCNREVKFGVFWNFAKARGADYIATGHYAKVLNLKSSQEATGVGAPKQSLIAERDKELRENLFKFYKGNDSSKDQSYFLWTLTQDDLAHTLFPVGHLHKADVRKIAEKFKLPVATKKDSQGVCFLGPLDMKDFLKHYIESKTGIVLNESGEEIGTHDGAIFFTLGERHGFTIVKHNSNGQPLYVVAKDIAKNTITVSENISLKKENNKIYNLKNVNWNQSPVIGKAYTANIRYHGAGLECTLEITPDKVSIVFKEGVLVDKGQSIVIYDGNVCLGGGVVI